MSLTPHSRSIVCMWHLQMTSSLPIVCCPSISLFPFPSPIFSAHSLPRCICKCSTRLSFTALLCVYGCLSTIERKLNCYVYASILQCFAMYYCELFDRWHWVYSWFSTGCQVDSKVYFLKLCACEGRLGEFHSTVLPLLTSSCSNYCPSDTEKPDPSQTVWTC